MKVLKIEIEFPIPVELKDGGEGIYRVVSEICKQNSPEGMVLWPASYGSKPLYIPLTKEDEEERCSEFDDSIYHIGCSIRETDKKEEETAELRSDDNFKEVKQLSERTSIKRRDNGSKGRLKIWC